MQTFSPLLLQNTPQIQVGNKFKELALHLDSTISLKNQQFSFMIYFGGYQFKQFLNITKL